MDDKRRDKNRGKKRPNLELTVDQLGGTLCGGESDTLTTGGASILCHIALN